MTGEANVTSCPRLTVRILGRIAVSIGNVEQPLSRQSRRLLTCLAFAADDGVSLDRLATVLDPEGGLRRASVRMAVSRLRRSLAGRLAVNTTGYRLDLAPGDELDLDLFARSLSAAFASSAPERIVQLRSAMKGWSGEIAGEFADEEWARPVVTYWEEQRRLAVEALAAALLENDRANEAVDLLDAEMPTLAYRERPVELQMRALAACGRVTDALRAFARFHLVLKTEVGIEPSLDLRKVERDLLSGAQALSVVPSRPATHGIPANTFIGRDREVDAIRGALGAHRLVTLTGVGGVGKTRLALQVVAGVDGLADVAVVEMAPIGEASGLARAVADSIGVMARPGVPVIDSIVAALHRRPLLMVLDNCEHVVDAAAALAEAILAGTTDVRLLVTSRQPLGVAGEQRWPVEPLGPADAGRLFVDRARAVEPLFVAGDEVLAEICDQLDGIPLAIELAAARVLALSADEIAVRLGNRFRLLVGARRGPERHRTLRNAIGWSFNLLEDGEQAALCSCAVFAGGFDLAAATAVVGGDEYEVLDVLESLAKKSLLIADHGAAGTRFTMLETIRQFAGGQLAVSADRRDAHARHFARIASGDAFAEAELDNMRVAFEWSLLRRGDVDLAASIAADATAGAWRHGRFEPITWVEEVIPAATERHSVVLARLHMAATYCTWLGQPDRALQHATRVRELLDDPRMQRVDLLRVRSAESTAHRFAGRGERAAELDAMLAAEHGEARLIGLCGLLYNLPELARLDEAVAIVDDALAAARASKSPFYLCWALTGVARTREAVDPLGALDAAYEALALSRADSIRVAEVVIARDVAALESAHGDRIVAANMFLKVLLSFHRAGDLVNMTVTFGELARHFAAERPAVAATLHGTAMANPAGRQVRDRVRTETQLRNALGEARFEALAAKGAELRATDAVEYAAAQLAG